MTRLRPQRKIGTPVPGGSRHAQQCGWQEVSGITAGLNALASEYNAQMAKWNWRFTNVGQLPKGATEALPREFKPYQYQ